MLRLERKNVFPVFVQLIPSLFVQGAWNGISGRKQPSLPHKTDAPYLHPHSFGFRLPWRATMSSLFRAVVFAVVIGARPICGGARLKGALEYCGKSCAPLVKQLLYFSIIAVKPVLMSPGAVTKRVYGSIHNSLAKCVPLFCSAQDVLKRQC